MTNTELHLFTSDVLDALADAGYLKEFDAETPERFCQMQNVIRPVCTKHVDDQTSILRGKFEDAKMLIARLYRNLGVWRELNP